VTLAAVDALVRRAAAAAWFAAVGEPLTPGERTGAEAYLRALGRTGVSVDGVADWARAKALAQAPDWDRAWWEAEERLRTTLLDAAAARLGRVALMQALTRVTVAASDPAHGRAAQSLLRAGVADEALARAAAGAATQACYLAALATAADAPADHAFHAKFALVEAGRWPLGIVAGRLWVF
jgi:hypothetical protein